MRYLYSFRALSVQKLMQLDDISTRYWSWVELLWFTFYENWYFHDNDKQKCSKTVNLKFCSIEIALFSQYQHFELKSTIFLSQKGLISEERRNKATLQRKWRKNKRNILCVGFEINHKSHVSLLYLLLFWRMVASCQIKTPNIYLLDILKSFSSTKF